MNKIKLLKVLKIVKCLVVIIAFLFLAPIAIADNKEGTNTYKDYLFILVHGVNADKSVWDGSSQIPKYKVLKLKQVIENDLGFQGRVFCYTFNTPNGDNIQHARELGDRTYHNPSSGMNGKCWFEKAKEDFVKRNPGKLVPTKYIIITHSMGNYAVRAYIYSDYLKDKRTKWKEGKVWLSDSVPMFDKGFYKDDVAKVVFIAPPFNGSDLAYVGIIPKAIGLCAVGYSKFTNYVDIWSRMNKYNGMLTDPYVPYKIGKELSFGIVQGENLFDMLLHSFNLDKYKSGSNISNIGINLESGMYGFTDLATWDMWPTSPLTVNLQNAKLPENQNDPAYSVIYGKGVPVLRLDGTLANHLVYSGVKSFFSKNNYFDSLKDSFLPKNLDTPFSQFDDELITMAGSGFWNLSTNQARFYSLLLGNPFGSSIEDGDNCVPVSSARPNNIRYLKSASYYPLIYKSAGFENYLTNELPTRIEAAAALYGILITFGYMDPKSAFTICEWILVLDFINNVHNYQYELRDVFDAHTLQNLTQFKTIKTALLDTPAIFTVQDIQANVASTSPATSKTTAMAITSPRAPPKGYESLKIKTIKEDRAYKGNQNMTIPITIDGDRKYVNEMVFTKPPLRIEGKLNYLIPARMKQFQYSFNFAAWKDIKNVDSKTGEFVLDKLPFAEGQNVLAIRAINAVDVSSHQICKFIINTIPMVISKMFPLPNSYTNNNKIIISGEFNKSVYSTNIKVGEGIPTLTSAELYKDGKFFKNLLNDPGFKIEHIKVNDYQAVVKFLHTTSSAFEDGKYEVRVKAKSSVGSSQGTWSFWIDTTPPDLEIYF